MSRVISVSVVVLAFCATPVAAQMADFSGEWDTTFGPLTLVQEGDDVQGVYSDGVQEYTLAGQVEANRLTFTYNEAGVTGEGWFELSADGGEFSGRWRETGQAAWSPWTGTRLAPATFNGLWETSYGPMRLVLDADRVQGVYAYGGGSQIGGNVAERRLTFEYREPDVAGEGWFELSEDGQSFSGRWRESGAAGWGAWEGRRIQPQDGLVWLVVLEARWEQGLAEREYAFGEMLQSFFARVPHVQVRHRYFDNVEGLRRWSHELAYLAEPAVVVIASHGSAAGVTVGGATIGPDELADCFSLAGTTQLVHFSACDIMRGNTSEQMLGRLQEQGVAFPVSGYKTSVDWAASAIIEFTYLELILNHRLDPEHAAEKMLRLLPFAGEAPIPDVELPPAGFRILSPSAEPQVLREAA